MKIFRKERLENGERRVYMGGVKLLSYRRQVPVKVDRMAQLRDIAKYCSDDALDRVLDEAFYLRTGRLPCEDLTGLNEKIIWMMMFDATPLKTQCADKYTVRDYVSRTIGDKYVIPVLAKWDCVADVNFDDLPSKFVLKSSEGCGRVMLVPDKDKLDREYAMDKIRQWVIRSNFWSYWMEMQYRGSARKIVAEEFIDTRLEYKVWCFHGKVRFIKIEIMRGFAEKGKTAQQYGKYFYPDWTPADFKTIGDEPPFDIPRPARLDELIDAAQKLAKPFELVRVDFFETNSGDLKLGEMTFSPAAGFVHFCPGTWDKEFGAWLTLPPRDKRGRKIGDGK